MEEQAKQPKSQGNAGQDTLLQEMIPPSTAQLVGRLEELVRMVLDMEKHELRQDVSFVEIMKSLALVQKAVEFIASDQETIDIMLNLLKAKFGDLPPDAVKKTPEEVKLLERIENLKTICEAARDRLHKQLQQNPEAVKAVQEQLDEAMSTKKRKTVRRKRKFRAAGGEGGWIKT